MNEKIGGSKKVVGTRKKATTVESVTKYSDAVSTIARIDTKLAELGDIFENKFKTNGDIKMPHVGTINVHHIKNIATLIVMFGELQTKEREYNLAAQTLKIAQYPAFNWHGYSIQQWHFDISRRIAQIGQYNVELELKALRTDMQEFVTKEDKFIMLQDKLKKLGL